MSVSKKTVLISGVALYIVAAIWMWTIIARRNVRQKKLTQSTRNTGRIWDLEWD